MSLPPPVDARQHPRFAVHLEATLSHESQQVNTITKDMSRGGICLLSPMDVPCGVTVTLSLYLSLGSQTFSESLKLEARVIWCTPVNEAFQIGALFVSVNKEQRGYLEMFLRFLQQEVLVTNTTSPEAPAHGMFDIGGGDDT